MKKKSILLALLAIALIAASVAGIVSCGKVSEGEYVIVAPDGAPALAVSGLAGSSFYYAEGVSVRAEVVAASEIGTRAAKADMAIVPANVAAKLFNEGSDIKVVATVTHGNLYMVGMPDAPAVTDLTQLEGKIVASIGKGSVPDSLFKAMLTKADVEYVVAEDPAKAVAAEGKVTLIYGADGAAVIPQVVTDKASYGIIGEPAVSTAAKSKGLQEKADMQALWNEANGSEGGYSQAVLIMKSSLVKDVSFTTSILSRLQTNADKIVSSDEYAKQAVSNIKTVYESTSLKPENMTASIIKRSNVKIVSADTQEGLAEITAMLKAVLDVNPQSIGGKVPAQNSGFYFTA